MFRGHASTLAQFRHALATNRLASTFLFVGLSGIGKRSFALRLAQGLLCERRPDEALDPCGECPSCRQVLAGSHPDVQIVAKPADKAFIPVELLIGDKEHRMREGLCYSISLKPYSGRRKIAIIDDADYFNKEGANCLLKTLEEPPPKSILILIGTSEQRQLPTIRSRCQIVRFSPLAETEVAEILVERGICSDANAARQAARMSGGSVERAAQWCDESLVEFRGARDMARQSVRMYRETYAMLEANQIVPAIGGHPERPANTLERFRCKRDGGAAHDGCSCGSGSIVASSGNSCCSASRRVALTLVSATSCV